MRGLEILADPGSPPLLRSGRQRRDAQRAIEWIADMRKWRARPAKQKPAGAAAALPVTARRNFGQLEIGNIRLKGGIDPTL